MIRGDSNRTRRKATRSEAEAIPDSMESVKPAKTRSRLGASGSMAKKVSAAAATSVPSTNASLAGTAKITVSPANNVKKNTGRRAKPKPKLTPAECKVLRDAEPIKAALAAEKKSRAGRQSLKAEYAEKRALVVVVIVKYMK